MFDAGAWLRRHAFPVAGAGADARIGAEIELLSLDAQTGRPVSVQQRLLPLLREFVCARGGRLENGVKGGVRLSLPDGGAFAIEPGGQLEYASPPLHGPSALLRAIEDVLVPLHTVAADAGIALLGAGIDPCNGRDAATLQVVTDRYCRMDAYFESIGPAGRRMMRQTAAVQINVDPAGAPGTAWRALNGAAPVLTALFANSRRYAGADTGCASYRAETWRALDPTRTGIFACDGDAADEYARFAMNAPVMMPDADGEYRPLSDWLADGLTDEQAWAEHLTTLFPEVRPRRWFEIRSIDAQPIDRLHPTILLCAGLALDARATADAADLLGTPGSGDLVAAGRAGLADRALASKCTDLVEIALAGCARLGEDRCSPDDLERARECLTTYDEERAR